MHFSYPCGLRFEFVNSALSVHEKIMSNSCSYVVSLKNNFVLRVLRQEQFGCTRAGYCVLYFGFVCGREICSRNFPVTNVRLGFGVQ